MKFIFNGENRAKLPIHFLKIANCDFQMVDASHFYSIQKIAFKSLETAFTPIYPLIYSSVCPTAKTSPAVNQLFSN
jgi:hypothetical protein